MNQAGNDALSASAIVVASHPRSGTHLMIDLLRRQFRCCQPVKGGWFSGNLLYWNLDELLSESDSRAERSLLSSSQVTRPILKTHRRPDFFAPCQFTSAVREERGAYARTLMAGASKIYMYRPVIKVLTSLYAMSHPTSEVPFSAFIRELRGPWSRPKWWAVHLSEWMRASRTIVVSYDEALSNPESSVQRIADFLGEPALNRSPLLPNPPSSATVERLKRYLNLHRESTALMSYTKPSVLPSTGDLEFVRDEIREIDPSLPLFSGDDPSIAVV